MASWRPPAIVAGVAGVMFCAATPCQTPPSGTVAADTLIPGTPLELALSPETPGAIPGRRFELAVSGEGALRIDASSFDGDVVLRRLTTEGGVAEESDDGGIGWNARQLVEAHAGDRFHFEVTFKESLVGRVLVEAESDQAPAKTEFEIAQSTARWQFECGRAAQRRGDARTAWDSLLAAGQLDYQLRLFADSRSDFEELQSLVVPAGDAQLTAVCQAFLGAIDVRFGDVRSARDLLVAARDAAVAQKKASLEMFCQSNLGEALQQLGDLAGARVAYDRALRIARVIEDRTNEVCLMWQSADLHAVQGHSAVAREQLTQAVTLAEGLGQPDCSAQALIAQGRFLRASGETEEAARLIQRALDLATLPAVRASATGELGNVRLVQGRWPEARLCYEEVHEEALLLGDLGLQASALESLGVTHWQAGAYASAADRLKEALDLLAASGDRVAQVRTLLDLGSMRIETGELDRARESLEQALAISEGASSPELMVQTLGLIVDLDSREPTRLDDGLARAQQQLELSRSAGLHDGEARALASLAWLRHLRGQDDEAAPFAEKAVAAARNVSPTRLAEALSTQLDVALARRDLPTSRAAIVEARALSAGLPSRGLGIEEASLARSRWSYAQFAELEQDLVALELEQAPSPGDRVTLVGNGFHAACRAQGRALLEGIAEHRVGGRDAGVIALRNERQRVLADRDTALAALGAARREPTGADAVAALSAQITGCDAQAAKVLDELRRLSPDDAELDAPAEVDVPRLQRRLLADGALLLQFAEGQGRLYAYVLDGRSITWRDLGDRALIESQVRELVDGMSEPTRLLGPQQLAETGYAAWRSLLAPLVPEDSSAPLTIVPTVGLAALPFEALVTQAAPEAEDVAALHFVIDRHSVSYCPSPAVLLLLDTIPPRATPPRLLVLADPVVPEERSAGAAVPRLVTESASWARLPGTRTEALAIADLLFEALDGGPQRSTAPEGRDGQLSSAAADVYLGADATVRRLVEGGRRYSIVHVATHGAVDATDPRRSGLVLSSEGPQDDGFLSVPDVLDLDLDANLVVLSACDTARGPARRGEGVQSLARAFLYAGAREVVATLWQVDDRETEVVMRSFYRGLQSDRLTPAAALQRARLELRHPASDSGGFVGRGRGELLPGTPERAGPSGLTPRQLRGHPYFWAPFISIGPSR